MGLQLRRVVGLVSRASRPLVFSRTSRTARGAAGYPHPPVPSSRATASSAESAGSVEGRGVLGQYRQAQLDLFPQRLLRVAGVSFDSRQDLVRRLAPGQGVAFVKEPDNKYDPNAVRVEDLSGGQLGYVPRDLTQLFPHRQTFGNVQSVGKADASSGFFGVSVAVRPQLPSLTVEAFPPSLGVTKSSLSHQLDHEQCNRIQEYALAASNATCQITGAPGSTFAEEWRWDVKSSTIWLEGVYCVHRDIRRAKDMAMLPADQFAAAMQTLQEVNRWTQADCKQYLDSIAKRSLELSPNRAWRTDISWLYTKGICDR